MVNNQQRPELQALCTLIQLHEKLIQGGMKLIQVYTPRY